MKILSIPDELLVAYDCWLEHGRVRVVVKNATEDQLRQIRKLRNHLIVNDVQHSKGWFSVWGRSIPFHLKAFKHIPEFEIDLKNKYWVNFIVEEEDATTKS